MGLLLFCGAPLYTLLPVLRVLPVISPRIFTNTGRRVKDSDITDALGILEELLRALSLFTDWEWS